MANMLNCHIVVSEFKPKSHFYIPFQINTLGKDMNSLIYTAVDEMILQLNFYKVWFGIK